MKKKKSDKTNNSDLRNKAEKALNADAQPIDKLPDEEVRKLALELQVHQIELEMQNEELRNAHIELNKSQDEYINLYDFAPVGYLTISEKGLILRANLKFASMLCMERGSLIKKPLSRFLTRESSDKYYIFFRRALEAKEHETCEVEMIKRDGTAFYAQLECGIEQEEDVNLKQCRITISDITKRKKAEVKLHESEKQTRMWLENSPVCTKIVDLDFNLKYMSAAGIKALKIDDVTKLYGKPYPFDFFPESYCDSMTKNLKKVKETGGIITEEAPTSDIEGNELWFQATLLPVKDVEGRIVFIMIVSVDINERKRAMQELELSDLRLNMVGKASGVVVWDWNLITDELEWSDTYYDSFGYSKEDTNPTIKSWTSFIHPDDVVDTFEGIRKVINSGKNKWEAEYRFKRKDGSYAFTLDWGTVLHDEKGKSVRMIGVMLDITERKHMEESLRQSEKMKSIGTITAGISHEFNNILNIISGNVQLLQMDYKDHHQLMNSLHDIEKSIDDGVSITDRMRDFTHPDTYADSFAPADINTLIEKAVKFTMPRWRSMAQVKGLDYNVDMEGMENVSSALCNPNEIEEVFIDIINNALDAMPDGGTLSFRTWSKDDTVFASITDTGKGMIEDVKKNIFDPFFTTRRPEGTGLGLSASYTKMVKHGGKIEVDSEVGKGSTFTLQFPATNKKGNLITAPDTKQEIVEKSLSILVVDDEDAIRDILNKFLSKEGHNVKTVDNGADAINMIEGEWFDLVLTDLSMPNVNGYEVITAINKLDKRPKLCLMTGWNEDLKLVADESGKVDFIFRKPFKLPELAKQINNLFSG
mgnify:CR=1 FL=1